MDKSYPMVGEINIKKVSSWYTDANNTGAVLLTMPNIPRPLHELCPRNIMGEKAWEQYRLNCINHAKYVCEICGKQLTYGAQSHELYTYSYLTGTAVFQRCVCLCGTCHAGIHSGRSVTRFKNGEISKERLLEIIENAFRIVWEYNYQHSNQEPLRLYKSFRDCLKVPEIHDEVAALIQKYDIKFYKEDDQYAARWREWHLIYENATYSTKFKKYRDWDKAMEAKRGAQPVRIMFANPLMGVSK